MSRLIADYVVSPGEALKDNLEALDMTRKELAERTGLTPQSINRILKAEQPVTPETALKLEKAIGAPASFWMNLESNYREDLARLSAQDKQKDNIDWLGTIPLKVLKDNGIIDSTRKSAESLDQVLSFFGVASVEAWETFWNNPAVAARCNSKFETRKGSLATWIRFGELKLRNILDSELEYNKEKFLKVIHDIRDNLYDLAKSPQNLLETMIAKSASAGVALTVVPGIPKAPWHGATKWIGNKALIILSPRQNRLDSLIFSFFHESSHVLHDGKKYLYIAEDNSKDDKEIRADRFASEILLKEKFNKEVVNLRSPVEIISFAADHNLPTCTVVGRLHHLTGNFRIHTKLLQQIPATASQL